MKCFFHSGCDAAALCKGCGRALCAPCADRFTVLRCQPCLQRLNNDVAREHRKRLAITAILYSVGLALLSQAVVGAPLTEAAPAAAVGSLAFPMAYWGWRFLSRFDVGAFLVPVPLWLFLIVVHLLIATAVGAVAAPIGVANSVRELLRIHRTAIALQE